MAIRPLTTVAVAATLFLGACAGEQLFPSFSSTPSSGGGTPSARPTQTGSATVQQRVQSLRADQLALDNAISAQNAQLQTLRAAAGNDARAYTSLTAQIATRLQAGTTPGNPELVARWNEAQAKLDAMTVSAGQLNSLATQVTTQASVAGYLIESTRATYSVSGAVDEDHRQLRQIESQANRSLQAVDRLIADLNAEIARQNAFLASERANLAALSYGVNSGRLGTPPGGGRPFRR